MFEIRLAEPENVEEIMSLYRSLVGTKGLTWSEDYPLLEDVERDIAEKSLYIAVSDGEIIAAAGAGVDEEVAELSSIENVCSLYRVGVRRDFQRKGIAGKLLEYIKKDVEKRGFCGMFFLVAKGNEPALGLYEKHGFKRKGEAFMFGFDFWCYEINFKEK
ncbi:MAG: GNAT family N-acetyltransferase [Oscillospiraceae bacterium]